jgi:hypothetical protein
MQEMYQESSAEQEPPNVYGACRRIFDQAYTAFSEQNVKYYERLGNTEFIRLYGAQELMDAILARPANDLVNDDGIAFWLDTINLSFTGYQHHAHLVALAGDSTQWYVKGEDGEPAFPYGKTRSRQLINFMETSYFMPIQE